MKTSTTIPRRYRSEDERQADKFLWHLRPPWDKKFSHDDWWVGHEKDVPPEAALWEAMRRHPMAHELMEHPLRAGFERMSVDEERVDENSVWRLEFFVTKFALEPWPKLGLVEQRLFLTHLWALRLQFQTACTPPGH